VRACALVVVALSGCNSLLGVTDPAAAPVDGDSSSDGDGGNQRPTVSITTPANSAVIANTIDVVATAADPDGTIASVKFELPDGSSVVDSSEPYSTSWNSTAVANGGYQIKATATDNAGATATATATVAVQNCINGMFAAADLPIAIPDNDPTGVTSNLTVVGNGNVGVLTLSLKITHTFRGDLVVTLFSPAGTSSVVSNREGGATANIVITDQVITTFNGTPAAGVWKLKVQDLSNQDIGTIDAWSLKFVGACT
jgi:proprotein convertase P-domain-containing protein/Big-like domain-containing protein